MDKKTRWKPSEREPVYGKDFETVRLLDKKELCQKARISEGSFAVQIRNCRRLKLTWIYMGLHSFLITGSIPARQKRPEAFTLNILCRALLLIFKDEGENDTGKVNVFVDGHYKMTADPRINGWLHCNTAILFSEAESREHIVEILPAPGEREEKIYNPGIWLCIIKGGTR